MSTLTLRVHKDDSELLELIERTQVKVGGGYRDRTRTIVWALIHCDLLHDYEDIREQLEADGEAEIEISLKKDSENP